MTSPQRDPDQWPDDFPDEVDWQELTGEISSDFVDRTWQRVRRELSDRSDGGATAAGEERLGADPDSISIPPEVLAAYTTPAPSADFVAQTMARIQRDTSPAWQSFLAKYSVPRPSADFVDRVLSALRESPTEKPAPVFPLRRVAQRSVWWAAAAIVLITIGLIALRQPRDESLPFEVLSADTFSPSPWGAALSERFDDGLVVDREDPFLRLAALVGVKEGD